MSGNRGRSGRTARAQRRDVAEHRAQTGQDSGPRQALTHRMALPAHLAGLASEPEQAPAPERAPEPTVTVVRCTARSDRGGSIGPCGALHRPDQPCPRRGVHLPEVTDD